VVKTILSANKIFSFTFESFLKGDRTQMHQTLVLNDELTRKNRKQKNKIIQTVSSIKKMDIDSGYFYIQINDYMREIAHSLNLLSVPLNEHLENQYRSLNDEQMEEIRQLVNEVDSFFNFALYIVKEEQFETIDEWIGKKDIILATLSRIEKGQINRIKMKEVDVRNSLLFFKALSEIKNLMAHSVSLIKSYHSFILVNRKSG
jgi:Na+/phosphate symporter